MVTLGPEWPTLPGLRGSCTWNSAVRMVVTRHISNVQQPHVAGGCQTGQLRSEHVSTGRKFLWTTLALKDGDLGEK